MSNYICKECNFKFDEPMAIVERHGFNDGFAEHFHVCPNCAGDYEELFECDKCGAECEEDELYNGLCEKCLRDAITYQNALEYMTSCAEHDDEVDLLEHFMFNELGVGNYPGKHSSKQLKALLKAEFNRRAYIDEVAKSPMFEQYDLCSDFLESIREFIIQDDGGFTKSEFAERLAKKGGANE